MPAPARPATAACRLTCAAGLAALAACANGPAPRHTLPARAPARAEPTSPEALAREALHLDGTDARLARVARLDAAVSASVTKLFVGLDDEARPPPGELEVLRLQLADTARAAFVPERLTERAVVTLAEGAGQARAADALRFFRSPLFQRMAFARADVETPAGRRRMGSYLSRLPGAEPDVERRDRLLRLVTASGEDELFLRLSYDVTERFFAAVQPAFPAWADARLDTRERERAKARDAFRTQVRKSLVLEATYAFRKLSLEELDEALGFWEGEAGRAFSRARLVAVTQALEEAYAVAEARLATSDLRAASPAPGP